MTGEYLRWGQSVWGAIWGVPPGRPVVHGGGNQRVSAFKRSFSGQTAIKVSANGTLSVQGVAAEHARSSVSLSGGGAIGLVASKRAAGRFVVAGGGIATAVGSAYEAISASVSISGGGSQATTARKDAYWGLPIDDGTYFRWGVSEWGAIWGAPPTTEHAVTGGGHVTAAASKAVRVEHGPVASGGGEPVVLARQVRTASVAVSGSGDVTVHGAAQELASGSLTVTGGGEIALTPFKIGRGQVPEQSAGGEVAVHGAKGIPALVSVSGSGTLLLFARKSGFSRASVSADGFLAATGHKGTKVSVVVSSGGLATATAHKGVDVIAAVSGGGFVFVSGRREITIRAAVHVTGSGVVLVTCLAGRYAAVSVTGSGRSSITFQGPRWALVPTRSLHGHKMPLKSIGEVLQPRRLPVCNIETKPLKGKIIKPRCTEWEVNEYR